ncbi:hypothetical protein BGZ79_010667 [Entomortierella chlamydospora]|nr:hypothetical protein BGZ79_010667 [Entomortierella chlamydospora]
MMFTNSFSQARFWKTYVSCKGYSHGEIPDLTGKVAIVTGANTGLGYATTVALAAHGAHVFLACRSQQRATDAIERAKKEIKEKYPQAAKPKLEFLELDLNDLAKSRQAARNFKAKNLPLHILVCNSGIMLVLFALSADGIETQFAVNHMGHFVFTLGLLDRLKESQPSRIAILSSIGHEGTVQGGIDFDYINDETKSTSFSRYGRSKLANVLFAKALARRLEKERVYVNVAHPGYVRTELTRYSKDVVGSLTVKIFDAIGGFVAMTPTVGSLTQLYIATSPKIESEDTRGRYFIPIAHEILPSSYARDEELQEKLWTFSEKLVHEKIGELY